MGERRAQGGGGESGMGGGALQEAGQAPGSLQMFSRSICSGAAL